MVQNKFLGLKVDGKIKRNGVLKASNGIVNFTQQPDVENLLTNKVTFTNITFVTQTGSITNGVTANTSNGCITTVKSTLGPDKTEKFTVTNAKVKKNSLVSVQVIEYNANPGMPFVHTANVKNGSFDIRVKNIGINALDNAPIKIFFSILN